MQSLSTGKSAGHVLRDQIQNVALFLYPYLRVVVPNFRAAHYVYIVFMAFLGSVILYGILDVSYIDALFMASGSATQAGLNTVNLNELKLLQQLVIYFFTTLCTPIFIHSSVLFVRLFWFERHFDSVKEQSKLDHKMRKLATLAAMLSKDHDVRANTMQNQELGMSRPVLTENTRYNQVPHSRPSRLPDPELQYPEPSDDEDPLLHVPHNDGIRFSANLPHPARRRAQVEPSDMYKLIAMLQNKHTRRTLNADEDVLVIKSPNEIERDQSTPIFTRKALLLQKMAKLPKTRRWSNLRRTLSGLSRKQDDDRALIDSEKPRRSVNLLDLATDDELNSDAMSGSDFSENSNAIALSDDDDDDKDDNIPHDPSDLTFVEPHERKPTFSEPQKPNLNKRRSRRSGLRRWRTPLLKATRSASTRASPTLTDDEDEEDTSLRRYSTENDLSKIMSTNYLSWVPTVGKNSAFMHLTEAQKEELGGVEYRATKLLIKILAAYYFGFHIVALCMMMGYIYVDKLSGDKMRAFGIKPAWWAGFTAQSTFNDLGFTLSPNSMSSFDKSVYVLIVLAFFIVIGNTGFPVFLRFILWVLFKLAKPLSLYKESLGFLLDHPRRCFTMLFPLIPTWWLFLILVILNATDLVLFIILDFNSDYLLNIPKGYRVLDGLFQAFSTRTAGFSCLTVASLHPAVQVSYMIMMYISVLPMAISIRRTNVYEEQSLGIYLAKKEEPADPDSTTKNFIGTHLRNQLSFDLWFIFLGLFIICCAEGHKIKSSEAGFAIFSLLFEIISAYGTVGLSLSQGIDQSLSNRFTVVSKLVIIAMMIRGRHRGLPYSLDRAIMLPSEAMHRRDRVQEHHALQRAATHESLIRGLESGPFGKLGRLRSVLSRSATQYRRNSLFPAPTRLESEEFELGTLPRERSV